MEWAKDEYLWEILWGKNFRSPTDLIKILSRSLFRLIHHRQINYPNITIELIACSITFTLLSQHFVSLLRIQINMCLYIFVFVSKPIGKISYDCELKALEDMTVDVYVSYEHRWSCIVHAVICWVVGHKWTSSSCPAGVRIMYVSVSIRESWVDNNC